MSSIDGRYSVDYHSATAESRLDSKDIFYAADLAADLNFFDLSINDYSSASVFLTIRDHLKNEIFIIKGLEEGLVNRT